MASLLTASCAKKSPDLRIYKKSRSLMHTVISITVAARTPHEAESAIDEAFSALERFEHEINFWDEESEISDINRNAGMAPVKVSPSTLDIIEKALYVSEMTGGAFDATIGPIIRLWDFKKESIPTRQAIGEKLPLVDYREIKIDVKNSTAFLGKKGMSFDTGGIAKGYGADIAVKTLKANGIGAGLVAVSGDIRAFGHKPDGKPWRVGIRNPRAAGKEDEIMAEIELTDAAVSTSGDYERFFIKDGIRYHHLIDPSDGMPATGSRSVSVVAKEAVLTDGFSTGIFVMGTRDGLEALEKAGLEGIIVDTEGRIHITDGIKDAVTFRPYIKAP